MMHGQFDAMPTVTFLASLPYDRYQITLNGDVRSSCPQQNDQSNV